MGKGHCAVASAKNDRSTRSHRTTHNVIKEVAILAQLADEHAGYLR